MSEPVRGRNLTYSIANSLGIAIVTGTYTADNPIPTEAKLRRQFDASRSALREAVKMLTAKGLLGSRPNVGTWVQPEDEWNLLDPDVLGWLLERRNFPTALLIEFTEIRLAIEPSAAALAARVAGPTERTAIREAVARLAAAVRGDDDPLEAEIAFHVAVMRASRNRFYVQLTGFTSTALRISTQTTNRYKGVQRASIPAHSKIADAIFGDRPVAAGEAMRKLIQKAMDLFVKRESANTHR